MGRFGIPTKIFRDIRFDVTRYNRIAESSHGPGQDWRNKQCDRGASRRTVSISMSFRHLYKLKGPFVVFDASFINDYNSSLEYIPMQGDFRSKDQLVSRKTEIETDTREICWATGPRVVLCRRLWVSPGQLRTVPGHHAWSAQGKVKRRGCYRASSLRQ
jgi:hypothetical protein